MKSAVLGQATGCVSLSPSLSPPLPRGLLGWPLCPPCRALAPEKRIPASAPLLLPLLGLGCPEGASPLPWKCSSSPQGELLLGAPRLLQVIINNFKKNPQQPLLKSQHRLQIQRTNYQNKKKNPKKKKKGIPPATTEISDPRLFGYFCPEMRLAEPGPPSPPLNPANGGTGKNSTLPEQDQDFEPVLYFFLRSGEIIRCWVL